MEFIISLLGFLTDSLILVPSQHDPPVEAVGLLEAEESPFYPVPLAHLVCNIRERPEPLLRVLLASEEAGLDV